jgi:2-dehydro-3-deoxyphosphogluconate aldolase/(4S)-4-hydroxy-2-oxoglutarate aldolase
MGAEIVKIFPGGAVGGPKFIAAVKGPMPWVNLMPTSGVEPTEESIKAWFQNGAACIGLGTQLFTKEVMKNNDWLKLKEDIIRTLGIVRKFKNQTLS